MPVRWRVASLAHSQAQWGIASKLNTVAHFALDLAMTDDSIELQWLKDECRFSLGHSKMLRMLIGLKQM